MLNRRRGVARPQGVACDIGAFEGSIVGQGSRPTAYFPLESRNEWTYRVTDSAPETHTETYTLLDGTVEINGWDTKAIREGSAGFVSYYTNNCGGVKLHRQFVPDGDFGDGVPRNATSTFSPPLQLAAAQTSVGNDWLWPI